MNIVNQNTLQIAEDRIDIDYLMGATQLNARVVTEVFQETSEWDVSVEDETNELAELNFESWRLRRFRDAAKIAWYLQTQGEDITWFQNVMLGKQDPWEKLKVNDVNKQMAQFHITVKQDK